MHLYYPQITLGRGLTRGVTAAQYEAADDLLDRARSALVGSQSGRADADLIEEEIAWSIDVVAMLTRDARCRLAGDGKLSSIGAPERAELASTLEALLSRYRRMWHRRNRPGGLDDSCGWLENLLAAYRSGHPDPRWAGWPVTAPT